MRVVLDCDDMALIFKTKDSCLGFFSRMLHSYDPPTMVSAEHARYLSELIKHHPNCDAKVGPGIDRFEVRYPKYAAPSFHILRTDGSVIDFSYRKAVRGYTLPDEALEAEEVF